MAPRPKCFQGTYSEGVKITGAALFPVRIPRLTPLALAYATRTACRAVYVRLDTDARVAGWGEAVPVREVTGERYGDVVHALSRIAPALVGADPLDTEVHRPLLDRDLATLPSARCALDTALQDLKGRALGLPAARLLGGARPTIPACVTLGLGTLEETVATARARVTEGFTTIKLKVAAEPAVESARIQAVRAAVGPAVELLLDANQAYDVPRALALADAAARSGVALFEQPVPADDLGALGEVARRSPVPVCADEAVTTPLSLLRLFGMPGLRMVNVKLQKCGGPSAAAWMIRTAEAAGVSVMVGCMIETRLGITAGLAVALGLANVARVDLDGAMDLTADPVIRGGVVMRDGRQSLPDRPGLGCDVDEVVLAAHRDDDPVGDPA